MKVIIPAAIMQPFHALSWLPKRRFLLPVAGKPIISHLIDNLRGIDIDSIILIVNEGPPLRPNYFGQGELYKKLIIIPQPSPAGIAHAVDIGLDARDREVLIVFGDTIFGDPIEKLTRSNNSVIAVKNVDDPENWGVAEIDDNNMVTRVLEKYPNPKSRFAMCGAYYFKDAQKLRAAIMIQPGYRQHNPHAFTDAIQCLLNDGEKILAYPMENSHDIQHHLNLIETNKYLLGLYYNNLQVRIDWRRRFDDSVILNPVFIGSQVTITKSIIGPNVSIANNTSITASIISNSIIGEEVQIENAVITDSVLGSGSVYRGLPEKLDFHAGTKYTICTGRRGR